MREPLAKAAEVRTVVDDVVDLAVLPAGKIELSAGYPPLQPEIFRRVKHTG